MRLQLLSSEVYHGGGGGGSGRISRLPVNVSLAPSVLPRERLEQIGKGGAGGAGRAHPVERAYPRPQPMLKGVDPPGVAAAGGGAVARSRSPAVGLIVVQRSQEDRREASRPLLVPLPRRLVRLGPLRLDAAPSLLPERAVNGVLGALSRSVVGPPRPPRLADPVCHRPDGPILEGRTRPLQGPLTDVERVLDDAGYVDAPSQHDLHRTDNP